MNPLITAAIILGILGGTFFAGDRYGRQSLQARLDAATVQAQAQAAETAKALAVAEQTRRALSQQLEDAANAEPVSSPACLGISRVLRIDQH